MTLPGFQGDCCAVTGRARHAASQSLWRHAVSVGLAVFVVLTSAAGLYLLRVFCCGTWASESMFALMALAWLYLIREFLVELLAMNLGDC